MPVEQAARWAEKWNSWIGDKDRLLRLARIMNELMEHQREQALLECDKNLQKRIEEFTRQVGEVPPGWMDLAEEDVKSERERIVDEWSPQMEIVEKDLSLTRKGPPQEAIELLDPAFTDRLTITVPKHTLGDVHALVRLSRSEGCRVEARGSDASWVKMARQVLTDEVKRGVPWWSFLRTAGTSLVAWILIYSAFVVATWDKILNEGEFSSTSEVVTWASIGVAATAPAVYGLQFLLRKIFTGFEVTSPGATPRGGKAIAVISSLVASFLVGVVVNLLTR